MTSNTVQEMLLDIPQYQGAFHETITSQHKQYYLYNKRHDVAKTGEWNRENFKPLNQANLLLGRFCKKAIEQIPVGDVDPDLIGELHKELNIWQENFKDGWIFDTYRHAQYILTSLEEIGFPLWDKLSVEEDLLQSFVRIPYETKSFFQVSVTIPQDKLKAFLSRTINYAIEHPNEHYYTRELTIHHFVTGNDDDSNHHTTLKFILLPGIVNTRHNPIISSLVEHLKEGLVSIGDHGSHLFSEFGAQPHPNICVSQGSSNYKKFLSMLRIIDRVYAREDNYAYML